MPPGPASAAAWRPETEAARARTPRSRGADQQRRTRTGSRPGSAELAKQLATPRRRAAHRCRAAERRDCATPVDERKFDTRPMTAPIERRDKHISDSARRTRTTTRTTTHEQAITSERQRSVSTLMPNTAPSSRDEADHEAERVRAAAPFARPRSPSGRGPRASEANRGFISSTTGVTCRPRNDRRPPIEPSRLPRRTWPGRLELLGRAVHTDATPSSGCDAGQGNDRAPTARTTTLPTGQRTTRPMAIPARSDIRDRR